MKYLNLSSLFIFFFFLASCHSTEVVLRKSKVGIMAESKQELETESSPNISSRKEETILIKTEISSVQDGPTIKDQPTESVIKSAYTSVSEKIRNAQSVSIHSAKPDIKNQRAYSKLNATTKKHATQHSKGVFGSVGYSFGVVGLVFLIVGVVLFLIGGLIIDTLGALFIAFGFLFLLIWLVLAVLQGLFDVIL